MTSRTRAELFLLATTLIWGSTFVSVKIGLRDISAMLLIAIRFAMAGALLAIFFPSKVLPIAWNSVIRGSIVGLLLFIGFAAQTIGLHYTTASKSAFITSLMVVFAPLMQVLIERKLPTYGNIAGILIVCAGLWILIAPDENPLNIGDVLTLLCAFVFGLYIVLLDIVSKEMPTLQLTFLQMTSCAVLSIGSVLFFEPLSFRLTTESIGVLLYLTIFATVITVLVQTRFQKETTPTRAVIIFSIEPLFASVLAYLVLNEVIGTEGITGGALIIAGILVSELSDSLPFFRDSLRISR